ncbi:hypothetical protein H4R35_006852 [Dimargaris xerosporica]|nr:hypothetical protein H4R35_006852 [Dimargaris xerosporica]
MSSGQGPLGTGPPSDKVPSRRNSQLVDMSSVPTAQSINSSGQSLQWGRSLSTQPSALVAPALSARTSTSSFQSDHSDTEANRLRKVKSTSASSAPTKKRRGFNFRLFNRQINFSLDLKRPLISPTVEAEPPFQDQATSSAKARKAKRRQRKEVRRNRAASITHLDSNVLEAVPPLAPEDLAHVLTKNAAVWSGDFFCSRELANKTFTTPYYFTPDSVPAIRVSSAHSAGGNPNDGNVCEPNQVLPEPSPSLLPSKSIVRRFDFNQVPSANPVEDRHSRTHVIGPNGNIRWHIFGIYDGHSGHQTSEYIARWLPERIAVALQQAFGCSTLPAQEVHQLQQTFHRHCTLQPTDPPSNLPSPGASPQPNASLDGVSIEAILKQAFVDMDREIVHNALHRFMDHPDQAHNLLYPAITGSCAVVAVVDEDTGELYVAHCGDSRALLGVQKAAPPVKTQVGFSPQPPISAAHMSTQMSAVELPTRDPTAPSPWRWKTVQLTSDHNAAYETERARLARDHPGDGQAVVVNDRVLGLLAVTRAFGDASFKWHRNIVMSIYPALFPEKKCADPMVNISPPYVTAKPDIKRWKLRPQDRFLVLASDGLFEGLNNEIVAEMVGGFYEQHINPRREDQELPPDPRSPPMSPHNLESASPSTTSTVSEPGPSSQRPSPLLPATAAPKSDGPHVVFENGSDPRSVLNKLPDNDRDEDDDEDEDEDVDSDAEDRSNVIIDDPLYIPSRERKRYLDANLVIGPARGSPIYQDGPLARHCKNSATLLVENAFNVIAQGLTPSLLALQAPESSNFRDDVTVAVIFF